MSRRRKGDRAERELSNTAEDEYGWYAQRTASSGSATDRPRPDVVAERRNGSEHTPDAYVTSTVVHAEVKAWSGATGQLDEQEVDDLVDGAYRAGARPVIAVRPSFNKFDQWHLFDVEDLNRTPSGNYSVRKADLPGDSLDEVFGG